MHDPALVHWLHRITRATLVLWGEQDGIAPPAYGEKLAAAIPHSRFHTIPGAAHYPQIEHPEAVAAAIGEITLPEIQR
jgi:pimeloyl-ACP methyl ester carboxylesterase